MADVWFSPNDTGSTGVGTQAEPAKTFAQVDTAFTTQSFGAGDTLWIAYGTNYNPESNLTASKKITLAVSGTVGNECHIRPYTDAVNPSTIKPIIGSTGANINPTTSWEVHSGTIWKTTAAPTFNHGMFIGQSAVTSIYVRQADDETGTGSPAGEMWWFRDGSNIVYMETLSGVNPNTEFAYISTGGGTEVINIAGNDYWIFEDINFHGGKYGLYGVGDYNEFYRCDFQEIGYGIHLITSAVDVNGIIVKDCTSNTSASLSYLKTITTKHIVGAKILDNNIVIDAKWDNNTFGIPDTEGIMFWHAQDCLIAGNTITQTGTAGGISVVSTINGIDLYTDTSGSTNGNVIQSNYIYGIGSGCVGGAGITLGSGTATQTYAGNIIRGNKIHACPNGIKLSLDDSTGHIYNNTMSNCDESFYFNSGLTNVSIENNISLSPVNYHIETVSGFSEGTGTIDNNLYESGYSWNYNGTPTSALATWKTNSGEGSLSKETTMSTLDTDRYHTGTFKDFTAKDWKGRKYSITPSIGGEEYTSGSVAQDREVVI